MMDLTQQHWAKCCNFLVGLCGWILPNSYCWRCLQWQSKIWVIGISSAISHWLTFHHISQDICSCDPWPLPWSWRLPHCSDTWSETSWSCNGVWRTQCTLFSSRTVMKYNNLISNSKCVEIGGGEIEVECQRQSIQRMDLNNGAE